MAKKTSPVNKSIKNVGKSTTKARLSPMLKSLLERADQARREFKYKEAVELYTQAIDSGKLAPVHEFDALNGRFQMSVNDLGARQADADKMIKLARRLKDTSRQVLALIAYVRSADTKDADAALSKAKAAYRKARKLKDQKLEASALYALGRAYDLKYEHQTAADILKQALHLCQVIHDQYGERLVLRLLGAILYELGRADEATKCYQEALVVCRQLGDRAFEANVLLSAADYGNDFAKKLDWAHRSLQIHKELEIHALIANDYNSLSIYYTNLGLYRKGRDLGEMSVQLSRDVNKNLLAFTLETLSRPYLALSDYEKSLGLLEEGLIIAREQKDLVGEAVYRLTLGRVVFAQGKLKEARKHLQAAIPLFQQSSDKLYISSAYAWLAAVLLSSGHDRAARKQSAQAVSQLQQTANFTFDYPPQEIWWWRYKVLEKTRSKKEAIEALQTARQVMLNQVANISDEGLRRNHLNKVEINRDIMLEWARVSRTHKLLLELPETHVGSLSEQLRRVTEIGVQLNEHHNEDELLKLILDEIVELSGAERAILLLKDESGKLTPAAGYLLTEKELGALAAEAEQLTARVERTQQPILEEQGGSSSKKNLAYLQRVSLAVPLMLRGQLLGVLYADMRCLFGKLNQEDLNLLSVLCNQAASALENARLVSGLEQRVQERTEELQTSNINLEQRNAELAIINSVQAGLASKLNLQGIYDLVGDKVREIFKANTTYIGVYHPDERVIISHYHVDNGHHLTFDPFPIGQGLYTHVVQSRRPLLIGTSAEQQAYDPINIPSPESDEDLNETYLGVPIMLGEDLKGIVSIQSYRQNAFNESDVRLLQTLANSMSVALENARLFDEIQHLLKESEQRAAELAIINSVQQGLSSKLDMQAIYELVGKKIHEIFDAQNIILGIREPKSHMVFFPYVMRDGERSSEAPLVEDDVLTSYWLRTRQPFITKLHWQQRGMEWDDAPRLNFDIAVPLFIGDELVGGFSLKKDEREAAFSDSDVRLLQTLANSMSVALENARLFDETQRLLKETEQRNAELAIINSVQAALAAKLDMQGIYDAVGEKIRDIFDAQSVIISLFDHKTRTRHFPYNWEKGERILMPQVLPFNKLAQRLIDNKDPLVLNQFTVEQGNELGMAMVPGTELMKSGLFIPLISRDVTTGFISLQNIDHENAFSSSDVRLLQTLANSMSVALENAHLFDETQRLLKETEQRNAELAIINNVQLGLASKLDMQAIYNLVGYTVHEVTGADVVVINTWNNDTETLRYEYVLENGKRFDVEEKPYTAFDKATLPEYEKGKTRIWNDRVEERLKQFDYELPTGEMPLSSVSVPLRTGSKINTLISLQDTHREYAFSDSTIRLVETLANSMGVALESARLFDETQRLLNETEQRNAELAIINSVQAGLAKKLDLQEIINLVGDKLREIFAADTVSVGMYDTDSDWAINRYYVDRGERIPFPDGPVNRPSLTAVMIDTRESLLLGTTEEAERLGSVRMIREGEEIDKNETFMGVPILTDEKVIGAVSVQSYRQHAFSQGDLRLLQTLTNSMSVALENARLIDETQRLFKAEQERVAELEIINSIQQGLASQLDFQAIVDLVGDKLREVFSTQDLAISWYEQKTKLIHYLYVYEHGEPLTISPRPPVSGGIFETMVKTRQPIVANTKTDSLELKAPAIPGTDLGESSVAIPIISGDEVRGLVSIENYERQNAFGEFEMRLLTTVTASLGTALENARLFEETQRLLKETKQRAAELATINTVSAALAGELNLDSLIELVGEQVRKAFKADIAYVALLDEETNIIKFPYEHGQHLEPLPLGQGLTSKIIEKDEPLLINQEIDKRRAELGAAQIGVQARSYLGVPIFVAGKAIGVISVQSTEQENVFDEDDQRLLSTIAANVGVVLQNARLFEETQARNREITENLEQQTATSEILKVIASSPTDIQPVLDVIVQSAAQLLDFSRCDHRYGRPSCIAHGGSLWEYPYVSGWRRNSAQSGFNRRARNSGCTHNASHSQATGRDI